MSPAAGGRAGRFPAAPAHWLRPLSPPRPAELPGRQPPGVARPGGGDVLLVASDRRAHHALQAQPSVRAADQQRRRRLKAADPIKIQNNQLIIWRLMLVSCSYAAFVAASVKTGVRLQLLAPRLWPLLLKQAP